MSEIISEKVQKNADEVFKQAKNISKRYIAPDDDLDRNDMGATLENDMILQENLKILNSKVDVNYRVERASQLLLPRFGPLTYLSKTTTFILFDVPELKAKIPTAATDGINVWINQDFFERLKALEARPTSLGADILFILLHELSHKFGKHLDRMYMYPGDIANIAQDCWINANLISSFPNYAPSLPLRRSLIGSQPEDSIYLTMSSEAIADGLLRDRAKPDKQSGGKGKGKGKGQGGGGSSSGSGSPSSGSGGSPSSGGGSNNDNFDFGNQFENGESHTITPEEIMEILKETGLGPLGENLGYPTEDANTPEGKQAFDKLDEANKRVIQDAVFRSNEDVKRHGDKTPGAHMTGELAQKVALKSKGKVDFRAIAPEIFFGKGPKQKHYSDEVGNMYYMEELGDLLGTPGEGLWLGSPLPHSLQGRTINIVDTSASVSDEELQDAITLSVDMVLLSGNDDINFKVLMCSADTVARGEAFEINEENAESLRMEGVEIFGRGGTDFDGPLRQMLVHPTVKDTIVHAVVYTTDLGAPIPDFEAMEKEGLLSPETKIFFVATSSATTEQMEAFQKELGPRGRVIPLREGSVLDLSDESAPTANFKSKARKPGIR
ncbi:hypothetical protein [Castellaniella sp.]|uniref:hypothetical protein n=1 Tax=Castellaniella sp. TaxID=1955812 RepID=UPI0025C0E340|nr:hypothetical protein [Castellaniella sp.]